MNNIVLFSNDDFYISYVERRSDFARALDDMCHALGRPEPKDLPETALVVIASNPKFYILYGDHRESYARRVPNFDACMNYFLNNIEHISHSSDTPESKH